MHTHTQEKAVIAEAELPGDALQAVPSTIPLSSRLSWIVLYFLLSLPLGIFYFSLLVIGITLGVGLTIVWVGIPMLLLTLFMIDRMLDLEVYMAEHWLGVGRPAALPLHTEQGPVERLQSIVLQSGFWSNLAYLLLKLPLGILSFTLIVSLIASAVGLLLMPIAYPLSAIFHFTLLGGVWEVNSWSRAFMCMFVGIALAWASVFVINSVAEFWRQMIRHMVRPFQSGG